MAARCAGDAVQPTAIGEGLRRADRCGRTTGLWRHSLRCRAGATCLTSAFSPGRPRPICRFSAALSEMPIAQAAALLQPIGSLVERLPTRRLREQFLLDPVLIEGMHAAADESPTLANWHRAIAEPSVAGLCSTTARRTPRLGNTLLRCSCGTTPIGADGSSYKAICTAACVFPCAIGVLSSRPTDSIRGACVRKKMSSPP